MNELSFYPLLTDELIDACDFQVGKYEFFFTYQDQEHELKQTGKSIVKLSEPLDIWKIQDEGLRLKKKVKITAPHLLFGENGVAPRKAEIGICIIWTNRFLTQTGCILPTFENKTPTGNDYVFDYSFEPGEIQGDLELNLVMYLKEQAEEVGPEEEHLINEAGVTLGEIENFFLDFNSTYMDFPIEECNVKDQPLWWVEFSQWEDPKVDLFGKENICLYLNTFYDACPMVGESIKNLELLIQIISSTYLLIFQKMSDDELTATKQDIGLNPNSICSIMHQFIEACRNLDCELHWESWENLLKGIQCGVAAMLKEDDE